MLKGNSIRRTKGSTGELVDSFCEIMAVHFQASGFSSFRSSGFYIF